MKPQNRIHYAGALEWTKANGALVKILPGWAACCSGDRARAVRESGNHTYDRKRVTCKACLRCLTMAARGVTREQAGASIGEHLANGNVDAAYAAAKRWAGS